MDFGWSFIRPISKGVLYALKKMHGFIPNYGFVLIVFAFLVKLIVYPLTKKKLPVNVGHAGPCTRDKLAEREIQV